jgi:hypothetical protein
MTDKIGSEIQNGNSLEVMDEWRREGEASIKLPGGTVPAGLFLLLYGWQLACFIHSFIHSSYISGSRFNCPFCVGIIV